LTSHLGRLEAAALFTTRRRLRAFVAETGAVGSLAAVSVTSAAAIFDRLLHASHVLNIKGRSCRLRDLNDQLGRRN